MCKNILIDKELSLKQKRDIKNEIWEQKQQSIRAKQELEMSKKISQIEQNLELKMSRTQFKSKHSLKAVNRD